MTPARARREAALDREYFVLTIANDLSKLLADAGPAQHEARKALAVEIERGVTRWLRRWAEGAKK